MLSATDMMRKLSGVSEGSQIFVSYLAGRPPTDRAIREARRSRREGIAHRHFVGKFHRVWVTKKGDPVLTVLCTNRDDERTGSQEAYRTFNPAIGTMLTLEIVE